jgi:hypothetical protein
MWEAINEQCAQEGFAGVLKKYFGCDFKTEEITAKRKACKGTFTCSSPDGRFVGTAELVLLGDDNSAITGCTATIEGKKFNYFFDDEEDPDEQHGLDDGPDTTNPENNQAK